MQPTLQPIASAEQARSAVSDALFRRPRVVIVQSRSEAWFVETVFPGLNPGATVFVGDEETVRISTSARLGSPPPAFGTYRPLVHPEYPLLAILVVRGSGSVESCSLDEDLLACYSDNVASERDQQLMNDLTFLEPNSTIDRGWLAPGIGIVVPQVASRAPIVYRLNAAQASGNSPSASASAVIRYRKFFVPNPAGRTVGAARELGFAPWRRGG